MKSNIKIYNKLRNKNSSYNKNNDDDDPITITGITVIRRYVEKRKYQRVPKRLVGG